MNLINWHQRLSQRQQLWLLLLSAALLILAGLGLRDPWPADEPRFALMGRDMWLNGNWLLPLRGGELYPDKPPIFMWAIGLFYGLTGSLRAAFLLPSALASLGTLYLIYDLGRRLWDHRTGLLAGWLLLGSVQFVLQAKTAQIDALVCFWITLGCYGLLRHLLWQPDWRWYALAWFAMGLGIITKGVGFLPLLLLLPYAVARWRYPAERELHGGWRWWLGPLLLLLAVLLWGGPMLYEVAVSADPAFAEYRDNILFKQTGERYVHAMGHFKPFWYYLSAVIPAFWLPLSLMLPWLAKPWWRALRRGERRVLLPLGWILLVLLFFSLSPGKRGVYILPALPMLALVSAPYLAELWRSRLLQRLLWGVVALLALLLCVLGGGGLAGWDQALKLVANYPVEPWWMLLSAGLAGLLVCICSWRRPGWSWAGFMPLLWLVYSLWAYPLLNPVRTPSAEMARAYQALPAEGELLMVAFKSQYLLFAPGPLTHLSFHAPLAAQAGEAWRWQGEGAARYVLLPDEAVIRDSGCFDLSQAEDIGFAHRDHWLLLPPAARGAQCTLARAPLRRFHYQPRW